MVELGCLGYDVIRALKKVFKLIIQSLFPLSVLDFCPRCTVFFSFPKYLDWIVVGGRSTWSSLVMVLASVHMSCLPSLRGLTW